MDPATDQLVSLAFLAGRLLNLEINLRHSTLKEAAVALKLMTAEEFDEKVRPEKMIGPAH